MTGLDLMDAGYALGNYKFYDTMNETWKLATYLANVMGMVLTHLPFGTTWIGMNVYTCMLIGMTAAGSYLFIVNGQPENDKKELLLFIAELGAVSLCWAPSVILYHYLGYILMTVAMFVLYTAITNDNVKYYITAGIILGLCVAVRMPNITYMAFILPLWYYCFASNRNAVTRTLYCVGGYLIGLIIPIAYIEARYGVSSYPDMVISLFGMTNTATDYKPTSMVTEIFGEYLSYGGWLVLFLIYIVMGMIFFKVANKISLARIKIFRLLYFAGFIVVLRFCYGRGMFGLDYTDNFSIYKWVVVYLLGVIILCVWALVSSQTDKHLKLWSVFLIVAIFITPLGSNNGLYPIINNLFVVSPISVLLAGEFLKNKQFEVKTIITSVMICMFTACLLYGINFVFHDGNGTGTSRVSVSLKCDKAANGLYTSADKKEAIESLDSYLYDNGLNSKSLITYGNIPALPYIFNMKPAIFTTWADLDSNSLSRLEADLDTADNPVIIFGIESVDNMTDKSKPEYQKLKALEKFMEENGYELVYENTKFRVYHTN
jgi:hypothetical protein